MEKIVEKTEIAFGKIFTYDFDEELPGKEYVEKFDDVKLFSDGIKSRAIELGYKEDINNISKLSAFIFERCSKKDLGISLQTIKNWIESGKASADKNGRKNIYKLCFALEFNAEQAKTFFLKCYLERPFNFKDINESVYFFCLKNGKSYEEAKKIINEIDNKKATSSDKCEENTVRIGSKIAKLKASNELIDYITQNIATFNTSNKTATEKIAELIAKNIAVAEEYRKTFLLDDEYSKVNSIDDVLKILYGFSARESGSEIKKGISASSFPEYIKRNFPQRQQFENISKYKATYDVIRKALIMLVFSAFFMEAESSRADKYDIFDEFTNEVNMILEECGYVGLYWLNPYDWMIGYCAAAPHPIDALQDLISEFYLSDDSIY